MATNTDDDEFSVLVSIKERLKVTNFLLGAIFGAVCMVAFLT